MQGRDEVTALGHEPGSHGLDEVSAYFIQFLANNIDLIFCYSCCSSTLQNNIFPESFVELCTVLDVLSRLPRFNIQLCTGLRYFSFREMCTFCSGGNQTFTAHERHT